MQHWGIMQVALTSDAMAILSGSNMSAALNAELNGLPSGERVEEVD